MTNAHLKFVFLKTPQLRHKFRTHSGRQIFPLVRDEIYHAIVVDGQYEFFGKSAFGVVSVDDFNMAIREGCVSLVIES